MKSGSLATKLLTLLGAMLILVYFAFQIAAYFRDPLSTSAAYVYRVEDGVGVSGYLVREEEVLTGGNGGILDLYPAEGQRVGTGQKLATVYQNQAAMDRQNELEQVQLQLEQLEYAKEASENLEVSLRLDSDIHADILALRADLSTGRLADSEQHCASLRSLLAKRDYAFSNNGDLAVQIQELKKQSKSLQGAGGGATAIRAPKSGIYSALVDGYESVLTPAMLEGLMPSALAAVQSEATEGAALGKLIYGDSWYYATTLSAEEARRFYVGQSTTLRFAKETDRALEVQVSTISPEENGKQVVVFSCRKYLAELTLLRKQAADIIHTSYEGLRVPQNAVRVLSQTVKDEETGEERTEKITGVYCLVGMAARFKPAEILYTGDGFCLLRSSATADRERLRVGDNVIVTAEELYDGKIVG